MHFAVVLHSSKLLLLLLRQGFKPTCQVWVSAEAWSIRSWLGCQGSMKRLLEMQQILAPAFALAIAIFAPQLGRKRTGIERSSTRRSHQFSENIGSTTPLRQRIGQVVFWPSVTCPRQK